VENDPKPAAGRLGLATAAWTGGWSFAALFFGWLFYTDYWRLRACFGTEDACFVDEEGVVHHSACAAYGGLAAVSVLLVLVGVLVHRNARSRPQRPD
jgi:hypothetical protein